MNFKLEDRSGTWVVVYPEGSCHPATAEEVELWSVLPIVADTERGKALSEVLALCEQALQQNKETQDQLTPTEFMEQLVVNGCIIQVEKIRGAVQYLLEYK